MIMNSLLLIGRVVFTLAVALVLEAATVSAEAPSAGVELYKSLAPTAETRLRFSTDVSPAPGKPSLHIKVYDWVIGAHRELLQLPLEGPAVLELRSGRLATTIAGKTVE